ncbi:unnamed protein product [Urochloa humidicola]
MSSFRKKRETQGLAMALAVLLVAVVAAKDDAPCTKLTLHNLCPYPVWPLVTANTGDAPPVTVAQVSVGGPNGLAAYSVSLVDGFNVPVVVSPQGFAAGQMCPALGCTVDLAADCPAGAMAAGGGCGAGGTEAAMFKARCPETRTSATDVEAAPQNCIAPGELKVVFCPTQDSVPSLN